MQPPIKKIYASRNNSIQEVNDDEADVELLSPNNFFSTHINLIPMHSSVQGPRLFYGARFYNQALPLVKPDAPLVQNLDASDNLGLSFDDKLGKIAGSVSSDDDGEVEDVTPDFIKVKKADGTSKSFDLYNNFPFNRKSVTGDSTVLIKRDGDISKYRIEDYVFQKGDLVLSYATENKKSSWQEVTAYLKHTNDKKLYTVTFESGRRVTVTEDHSLLTLDKNGNIVPVYPLDCIINLTKSPIAFGNLEVAGDDKDRELGTLVGLYLAEGSLGKQKGLVSIAVQDSVRATEAKELVVRVLGVKPHDALVNCSFTSHEFQKFLRANCGSGSSNKFISNTILSKSRAYLEGLICGYMAGDGCLRADANGALQLTAVTVSKRLRDDLVDVLNILGIFTTLFDATRNHINDKWNDGYGFRIISCHANKLDRWFFYNDRHIKFNSIVKSKYRASPFEHIPLIPEAKKNLYKSFISKVPHFVYKSAFIGAVSKYRIKGSKGNFGLLANSDLLWDKITAITPAQHEAFVYDLEVNSSEAFAVNGGLLVHNTAITHTSLVKKGDVIKKGQLLARSNYNNDQGTLALGANARVGLVPFKGYSMDDAIVISAAFAKRLTSDHSNTVDQDFDNDIKGGLNHYVSLFPTQFNKNQLKSFDKNGVVKPGTIVNMGDPIILATRPRVFSSTTSQLGMLSKAMRQSRHDSSQVWDSEFPGEVTDVAKTKTGYKVIIRSQAPAQMGDKIVFRSGQKGVIANILSDDRMPRTADGNPLEVLLNPLGIPSRVNNGIIYELLLGKAAAAKGQPIKIPSFNVKGSKWYDFVGQTLKDNGLAETEQIFDPGSNKLLENPITVGVGHVLKLHHTSACFDDKTEVLTNNGWKLWEDIHPEDLIATAETAGNELIFEKPLHLFKYKYNGNLCAFQGRYVDYAVTPNHNLWCQDYSIGKNFRLRAASEVHGRRFKIKQFGFAPQTAISPSVFKLGNKEFAWDDFCEFVGWWVTEGCVGSNKGSVLIYQSNSANPEKTQRIEALLNRMGVKWSPYLVYGTRMGFAINEKSFATYFSAYGSHSQFKRVPRELIIGSASGCRRIVEAILLGDGSSQITETGPSVKLTTTSKQLADDFQELCIRIGAGSIIRPLDREWKKFKNNPHYLDGWHLSYTETRNISQVDGDRNSEGFKLIPYSGNVYCAEMRTGLLYVRRNGKPMLSGNSKASARGQGGYDLEQQPLKGGSAAAQAKRLSGLEVHSLLSAGAYKTLKEGATLRGQKNDEYWRALRQGYAPKPPGTPYVWDKFQALLTGAGLHARKIPGGKLRLGPFTDDELERRDAVDIKSGDTVDLNTLDALPGGLFDKALVGSNKWGKIKLPFKVPNPAFEPAIRHLLGLTEKELRGIMSGQMELPEHLRK